MAPRVVYNRHGCELVSLPFDTVELYAIIYDRI